MSQPYPRHPNTVILPPAYPVSPLIRFSRYVAFGLGIVWGIIRLRQISEYHADIREFEHWKKVEKKEHAEKVKHWTNKDETVTLIGYLGVPLEEGAVQFGMTDLIRSE
ncbi:unnamed protein product [Enterobius vermicularis]|uniref:ATP synthase F(0) complex subunit e, mitochondrial n=1 Tax=Enterobius vermicularis TaxID=51028 RepID=A0A0N4UYR7_ENTVE|nr:unnamed protein product [Enterobius vermicularis]